MKKIFKINHLVAISALLLPISVSAGTPQALLDYFNDTEASYIVRNTADSVRVVTWKWKTPTETCTDLKSRGVDVERVVNYAPDGDNPPIVTFKDCNS
jgi:hypothetical protein